MALPEMVAAPPPAAAPDSAHYTGEPPCANGVFKPEMPQELLIVEDVIGGNGVPKKSDGVADAVAGYSTKTVEWEDNIDSDTRSLNPGILPENGQPMIYTPGYGHPHQANHCSQPQGPYVSNYGPHYGQYYQQVVSQSGMQYFPVGQDGSKPLSKKSILKDGTQNQKVKSSGNAKGYQTGQRPLDTSNDWCVYPGMGNGGFYACDYYSQQWHSSAGGFQPIPPLQNMGLPGSCVPPVHGGGIGQYQNFQRVHCPSNASGRVLKGSSLKSGLTGSNWRAKDATKPQTKGEVPASNLPTEPPAEQMQKYTTVKPKANTLTGQGCGHTLDCYDAVPDNQSCSVNRSDYNKDEFQVCHEAAKFFIIKSYSEDDVHKSIKYNVWSSTPNGNKRLDEAYFKAQEKSSESSSSSCPVFFFFSVNCSGQFCGVAEMVGAVDFNTNMDFWLQGKWNGCLPVKWHIIKDVPNNQFRHIILSNNDNKPVTHSRDTQEVHFHQGLEMLKIFKHFPTRTSLLDDFAFYDNRQKILQDRKSKQQQRHQVVKQVKDRASEKNGNVVSLSSNDPKEKENHGDQVADEAKVENIQEKVAKINLDDGNDSGTQEEKVKPLQKAEGNTEALEIPAKMTEDKNFKSKVLDSEIAAITGKDDGSRLPINYKKALLGGMQGKAVTVDSTVGA